jgi:hypothetical protein
MGKGKGVFDVLWATGSRRVLGVLKMIYSMSFLRAAEELPAVIY